MTKSVLMLLSLLIATGTVELSSAQTSLSPGIDTPKAGDRVLRLQHEMERLQADVETLKRQVGAFQHLTSALQQQNAALRGDVDRLRYEADHPGNMQGLKRKYLQKTFWERIPADAWIGFWTRN
jgi:uncharacterized protein YlxW (UPF0749 family)